MTKQANLTLSQVQLIKLESGCSGRWERAEFVQIIKVRHGFKYNFN